MPISNRSLGGAPPGLTAAGAAGWAIVLLLLLRFALAMAANIPRRQTAARTEGARLRKRIRPHRGTAQNEKCHAIWPRGTSPLIQIRTTTRLHRATPTAKRERREAESDQAQRRRLG